ncbi:MAG: hypothetical protein GXY48_03105 [Methanomicrobiales archaeon]|nr:hypothetical protein [Methanomicrobiales archaeon]
MCLIGLFHALFQMIVSFIIPCQILIHLFFASELSGNRKETGNNEYHHSQNLQVEDNGEVRTSTNARSEGPIGVDEYSAQNSGETVNPDLCESSHPENIQVSSQDGSSG